MNRIMTNLLNGQSYSMAELRNNPFPEETFGWGEDRLEGDDLGKKGWQRTNYLSCLLCSAVVDGFTLKDILWFMQME